MSSEDFSSGFSLESVDDVDDFLWENEEENMQLERFAHLYDLMQMGNKAFRANHLEKAINFYARANSVKPDDPVILRNRCTCYIRLSSDSENRPLGGLDPTTLAEVALKDAERVMNIQNNSSISYILKADALILLERFEQAHDVILAGLRIDPQSIPLKNLAKRTVGTIEGRLTG